METTLNIDCKLSQGQLDDLANMIRVSRVGAETNTVLKINDMAFEIANIFDCGILNFNRNEFLAKCGMKKPSQY
jgi:hypothetical protein